MSRFCDFGTVLEENMRDQLVCGLRSEATRQRLFAEDSLQYAKAVKIASAMEAAERDAAAVEQTSGSGSVSSEGVADSVHAVQVATRNSRGGRGRGGLRGSAAVRREKEINSNCAACGSTDHISVGCRYNRFICSRCGQRGHLRRVCPVRSGGISRQEGLPNNSMVAGFADDRVHRSEVLGVDEPPLSDDEVEPVVEDLHQLSLNSYKPVSLKICIDGIVLPMEIDTGSLVSCISKNTYGKYFKSRYLEKSNMLFKFYDGSTIRPLGVIKPLVKYKNISKIVELFVIEGGTTSLLGRQWLSEFYIKIPLYKHIENMNVINGENNLNHSINVLLDRFKELFSEGLGRFTGGKAQLRVREGATPVFCRARPVPYALRERVEAELAGMLRAGVIEPVDSADWATPLVPVRKADGGLRICADYKVTLNPFLLVDKYPLPRINDLLVKLNGAKIFTKIDLSQAYNQIELHDPDNLTVINTHKGLFKYKRLVYGLSSSPGIFQRIMTNLLNDIPGVEVFIDDIIIGSPDTREHLITLKRVLERLRNNGMKLKKSKCLFMTSEVKYLGFIISAEGIKVDPERVEGIVNIPRPVNITDLRAFLGTINFYAKFVKNLSTILAPLYHLLRKGVNWIWNDECEVAFRTIKSILVGADVLAHYDPEAPLFLTCDASARGIGGVLTQTDTRVARSGESARERPVVYVSRALTAAEKHYSQIEREALAIVFCFEKLHQYLYGRRFTLRTDHKLLVTIFGPKQGIPSMAASRLQRWAIKLSAYTYEIEYVTSKQNGADGLSRLPASFKNKNIFKIPEQSHLHFAHNALLLDYNEIKKQTCRDPLLGRVLTYIRDEWPPHNEMLPLNPYFNRKKELYEELGCVMWGHRIVIPETCRDKVLTDLHEAHMGIVKTKSFARSYVWWPGIDEAIEKMCRHCSVCVTESEAPPRHMPCPWPWPNKPWARVHIDFLGPLAGRMYLVLVDARTKWIEVCQVPSTAASHAIKILSGIFARFGLPKQIVSDNGPPFSSNEFSTFVNTNGETPASLMFGRRLRTKFDAMRPNRDLKVRNTQEHQQRYTTNESRLLYPGDDVWLRQYRGNDKWVSGKVVDKMGTTDYRVVDAAGRETHRHIDQLKQRKRSSLICPSSPASVGGETGATSTEPETHDTNNPGDDAHALAHSPTREREKIEECVESIPTNTQQPSPPIEPPRSRPIRRCRMK
ncbi:uncharacterized protein K02A2.6-like [Melitaea cinxia]|uniref:uncharacterized protein K02A2.6-like n=2 Tax=Melitaea cinxia TaxID=113334 RepID=UPI001E273A3D|nr:uncharacterized protein K02A2.6-like [Melitaea cinxia]